MDLWSWGANTKGQLGHGFESEQISRPTSVSNPKITNLLSPDYTIKIDGGGTQTLICVNSDCSISTKSSTLIKIGTSHRNFNSDICIVKQSTQKSNVVESEKEFEPSIICDNLCISQIACGWDFNLVLTTDNQIFSWGCDNKYGQLGREMKTQLKAINSEQIEEIALELLAVKISAGLRRAAAVGVDGHIYVWGDNTKSDLGVGNAENKIVYKPTRVTLNSSDSVRFMDVKCGKSFTVALDDEGQFWGCGDNRFGQLGNRTGNMTCFEKLSYFSSGLEQMSIKQYECGWNHIIILLQDGRVLSFGRNNFGQLGRKQEEPLKGFDSISNFVVEIHEKVISIATGSEHNLALGESGVVYCWGWNEHESCGVESSKTSEYPSSEIPRDSVIYPTVLKFPQGTGKIMLISCGAGNGFAISRRL